MNSPRRFQWTAVLWRWLALSLLIPTCAIFARWIVRFATEPANISLLDMLSESEVAFLAAVILTETLGNAPHVGEDDPYSDQLTIVRMTLLVCMVFSFLMFGVFVPLTQTGSGVSDFSWVLVVVNSLLLSVSVTTSLIARRLYWRCKHPDIKNDGDPEANQVTPDH